MTRSFPFSFHVAYTDWKGYDRECIAEGRYDYAGTGEPRITECLHSASPYDDAAVMASVYELVDAGASEAWADAVGDPITDIQAR